MDFEKIGRARLMIRLPRHRKQLSELRFLALSTLIEAYGLAVVTRNELSEHAMSDEPLKAEYTDKCQAIEDEVVTLLTNISPRFVN
ncbi:MULTISPECIES: hypothetical protein [Ensifer]|uniref:Uncharacterized protein n=1 Tax=Ensifer adhaerens TaxID=106592 RepID=A0ABY8HSP1_ENSAD|nr:MULTISPECIES: hypothetical protein [Ensifer]KQZ54248.1 hypothetical protein ASD63_27855 [Ensifer sp. Root558]KRD76210.1 hypothetical protein ASE71_03660 [Ensifer sp. Root954]MBD9560799.1 hypothetical protein [Ensifer sp. ENS03]MBD9598015.1 hypothetical protein [Ensifer sp. ENS05]MBD9627804.1 hypothetical protein [Ensifer sp. ENS06]